MNASAEAKARWLFAGLLLLLAVGFAAWLLAGTVRYRTYEIRSGDVVSGLIPGAPVEFHGVEVGKVKDVQLLGPRLVRVLLQVGRDVPVTSATVATITGRGLATRGFTGYVYVSLEDGTAPGAPLANATGSPYPLLASAPSRQVSLDTSIKEINDSVQSLNGRVQAALDDRTVASLKQSLASLEKVTSTLSANNARLEQIIANAERASGQLQPLLQSGNASAAMLRNEVLPQVQATVVRIDKLSATMETRMDGILRRTDQASTRLEPLLLSGEEMVRTLQTQVLPEAQRTLLRLDQLSTNLDETAGRVRRNPSLLVRGSAPLPAGPGESP
jgi:phospholipid/cholesterol/gamma-HCH transport system substrate-binding protein